MVRARHVPVIEKSMCSLSTILVTNRDGHVFCPMNYVKGL